MENRRSSLLKCSSLCIIIIICILNSDNFVSADKFFTRVYRREFSQSPKASQISEKGQFSLSSNTINVLDYGAVGDGSTDDSEAIVKAWEEVCKGNTVIMKIPAGKIFMVKSMKFKGPCKYSPIQFQIEGKLKALGGCDSKNSQSWIEFSEIQGLHIYGDGQIDGHGSLWWTKSKNKCPRPTALRFHKCNDLRVEGLTHLNSPRNHISINQCQNVNISKLHIIAPQNSPNTDGIDISSSTNVHIHHSQIKTGDDCIAINGGSSFINIDNIVCGPGHGISVGSLGKQGEGVEDTVEAVLVKNCTFKGAQNGARIKTWEGGSGFARNITFEDIIFEGTRNPIVINQHYIDHNHVRYNEEKGSAVQVINVTYRNMHGTSKSKKAIDLRCSAQQPCLNIAFEKINITSCVKGQVLKGYAENAQVKGLYSISPRIKLKK